MNVKTRLRIILGIRLFLGMLLIFAIIIKNKELAFIFTLLILMSLSVEGIKRV